MASQAITTTTADVQQRRVSILDTVASRYGMDPKGFADTLRKTVFKDATNEEFAALLVVANEYRLNPLTKEIYAFKGQRGGIVPLVSIDGWLRIINEHPQFDGIEFEDIPDGKGQLLAVACVIYRKDRSRPIRVIEYLAECRRGTDPWKQWPARMLRHKATIQCARYAFGFSGIYDEDEAERISGGQIFAERPMKDATPPRRQLAAAPIEHTEVDMHDAETGEVIDHSPQPSDADGPDSAGEAATAPQTSAEPSEAADDTKGEESEGNRVPADADPVKVEAARKIIFRYRECDTVIDLNSAKANSRADYDALDEGLQKQVDGAFEERLALLKKPRGGK